MDADSFEVRGGCMRFLFRHGDQIRFDRVAPDELRFGDVVVFLTDVDDPLIPASLSAHRLLWKRRSEGGWTFWTKGDAVPGFDPRTPESALAGRVAAFRRPGREWVRLDGAFARARHLLLGLWSAAYFFLRGLARGALAFMLGRLSELPCRGLRPLRKSLLAGLLACEDL